MKALNTKLILRTKLQMPDLPGDYVYRQNLIEYLNKNINRPCTLVSAGAGYGKSTFVSSWFNQIECNKAWISLDTNDNDIREFLNYFIFSINEKVPGFGKNILPLISGIYLPDIQIITKNLINELNRLDELFILALDDLYFINNMEIFQLISTLLEHPPSNFHLVLISRIDPPIPLSKLRSRNMMKEIRVAHLKFNDKDIKDFLYKNIEISRGEVLHIAKILTSKVDGWITGLRLALIHLSFMKFNKHNLEELLTDLNFSEHYIVDEIIKHLDKDILEFLIQTSILNKINREQIAFIFERNDKHKTDEIIGKLVANNLFIINLDNERNWYRYHHLFNSFLRKELKEHYSDEYINHIHLKALEWYEKEDMIEDAFYHAMQLNSNETIANLIERNMYKPLNEDRWYVLNEWLKKLPEEIILRSPKLIIAQLWVAQHKNNLWAIPGLLEKLRKFKKPDMQIVSQMAFFEGFILFWEGKIKESIISFRKSLNNISKDKIGAISLSKIYYAIALQMNGEGEKIYKEIEAELYDNKLDNTYRIILYSTLVFIKLLDGKLSDAEIIINKMKKISDKTNDHFIQNWTFYISGHIAYQRNELVEAEHRFNEAVQNIHLLNTLAPIDCFTGLLICQKVLGKEEDYKRIYEQMNEWIEQRNDPLFTSMAFSSKARLSLFDNNLEQAIKFISQCDSSFYTGNTLFWIEHPRITDTQVLIAKNSNESIKSAIKKLNTYYEFAVKTHNKVLEMKSLIQLAIAVFKLHNTRLAKDYLLKVLSFAIPNGFTRLFIENGKELLPILKLIKDDCKYSREINLLIDEITALQRKQVAPKKHTDSLSSGTMNIRLSNREIEITNYLSKRYTNKEIANALFISEATVKRHAINIYQKLGVNKRRDAVRKAQELGLLS
jgi:LuxR family maltose regulon positive regulatory protein